VGGGRAVDELRAETDGIEAGDFDGPSVQGAQAERRHPVHVLQSRYVFSRSSLLSLLSAIFFFLIFSFSIFSSFFFQRMCGGSSRCR
jgi:hypothetical protein